MAGVEGPGPASAGEQIERGLRWVPLGLAVAALPWVLGLSFARSMGWDESMHAALPALRMALAVGSGDPREVLAIAVACQQYPFVFPAWLASAMALFGPTETVARFAARALWPLALLGLWWLGRELELRTRGPHANPSRRWLVPALAVAFGATSPMLLAFSGSLFLEVPSFVVGVFALRAWLRRGDRALEDDRAQAICRDLAAGAWISVAFFTKFNYGLLLGAGLFLDLAITAVESLRRRQGWRFAERTLWLAAPVALSFAWWFVLPWPGGRELGASHWSAFTAFLGGNQLPEYTSGIRRIWDLGTFLAPGPLALAFVLFGLLVAAVSVGSPAVRALFLVAAVSGFAIGTHVFFLDRFLLSVALAVWPLAALGLTRLGAPPLRADRVAGPRGWARAAAFPVGLVVVALTGKILAGPFADRIGVRTAQNRAVIDHYHTERIDLSPDRLAPTAGLARSEYDGLVDLVAQAAGANGRVGWIGASSELSPAALHIGLLGRGGSTARFRADAARMRPGGEPDFDVTWQQVDPQWSKDQLLEFARGFDVLIATEPIDLRRRAAREFMARYRGQLLEDGEFGHEKLGVVSIAPPFGDPYSVEVFACRAAR